MLADFTSMQKILHGTYKHAWFFLFPTPFPLQVEWELEWETGVGNNFGGVGNVIKCGVGNKKGGVGNKVQTLTKWSGK